MTTVNCGAEILWLPLWFMMLQSLFRKPSRVNLPQSTVAGQGASSDNIATLDPGRYQRVRRSQCSRRLFDVFPPATTSGGQKKQLTMNPRSTTRSARTTDFTFGGHVTSSLQPWAGSSNSFFSLTSVFSRRARDSHTARGAAGDPERIAKRVIDHTRQ